MILNLNLKCLNIEDVVFHMQNKTKVNLENVSKYLKIKREQYFKCLVSN
jgi:hypothetical protein